MGYYNTLIIQQVCFHTAGHKISAVLYLVLRKQYYSVGGVLIMGIIKMQQHEHKFSQLVCHVSFS